MGTSWRGPIGGRQSHRAELQRLASHLGRSMTGRVSLQAGTLSFVMLACLVLFALEGLRVWDTYHAAFDDGSKDTANLSRAIAQHAEDAIRTVDGVLIGLVDRLEVDGTTPAALERI